MVKKPLIVFVMIFIMLSYIAADSKSDYSSKIVGTLKYIEGGTFKHSEYLEYTSTIDSYYLSECEITGEQFAQVMGTDPSDLKYRSVESNNPVQNINWYHAIAFCNKLSILENLKPVYSIEGVDFSNITYNDVPRDENQKWNEVTATWSNNGYRLPTEMEWKWAAMGCKNEISKPYSGSDNPELVGEYVVYGYYEYANARSAGSTRTACSKSVGSRRPNELGLYDMCGNIEEWVWDWYSDYPEEDLKNYTGKNNSMSRKIVVGGFWGSEIPFLRIKNRDYERPYKYDFAKGFRIAKK